MTASVSDLSPYPGLRPFLREESHLFFGREECIATMVDRLEKNRFLAVLGASGSGKSSLVKVGLIEALERGDMQEAGRSWRIVQFKPQGRPMYELAQALLGKSASPQQIELMVAFLRRGPRSLLEWCESGQLKPGENLLVFVDQFEELFRYRTYAGREEAEAFVALILRTKNTRQLPVYVTLTMRSEFLGACAMIEDLAEAMNDGQFLTPQMNRDQCRAAIVGPARVGDFDVEPALVNRLLNDLASYSASDEHLVQEANDGSAFSDVSSQSDRFARRADQLPLLQHALNGLYSWTRAQSPSGRIVLKLKDYDALGGLQGSLNRHADSILAEVEQKLGPERAQKVSAKLFRGLVSGTSPADAQRRPVRFPDLIKLCDGDEAAVRTIVEAFRKTRRNFLTPDPSKDIDDNSIIDISHESFIRQWTRLSAWLETEVQDAQSWRRLADAAADEGKGSGGLLRGPNLQTLLYWRRQASPTKEWAGRYGATEDEYNSAISFLERSRRAQRVRRVASACLALAAGALLAGGYTVYQESQRKQQFAELEFKRKQQEADQEGIRIRQEADADKLRQRAEAAAADREKSEKLFRVSSKLFITTNQQKGNVSGWEESGSFIASLVDATPDENLDRILRPLQGRMVAQYAFRLPQDELGGAELQTDTRSYRLSLLDGKRVAVIDARTRAVQREFDLSAFEPVDRAATHSVSPDGKQALIILTEAETGKNSMVFVAGRPDGRSRTVKLPYTMRPDTLVADWNVRRVIWSQRRDDVPEIAILDFSKLDFDGSRTRQRPEIRCKPIFDIVEYTENNSLAQPFDKYETCSATTDNNKLEERRLKGKFRVVSLVDRLAIIQIILEDFPVSAQLVAVNTETGSARILVSSESELLVSRNLADDAPLRALTAVVTQGPRGSCAGTNERSPGKPAPDTESEACLSFVDNASGTPLDSPRYPLPLFDETRAYESIRLRADESNARLVLEFSQRPSRWSIEVPRPASILNARFPQASQQRESASSKILQWAGAKNLFSDLNEQRWQYRPESPTIKFLLFSDDAALIKTVQLNAGGTGGAEATPPLTIPRISESIGVPKKNRSVIERLPWLLSETADRIVVGSGTKLFELGINDPNPGKPILTGDLGKSTQPLEGGCRRRPGDGQSFSIQTVDDWPGRNPAFLLLDSLGRVWRVASRADKSQNSSAKQIAQDPNPGAPAEPVVRDSEPAGSGTDPKAADQETSAVRNIICVTGSNLTLPIIALAPGSGRLLLQRDPRMLLVVEAPDGGDATKLPEPISKTPFDDDIVAATFIGTDRIAVLFKGGALTIFSQVRGRWTSRGIPDVGFVSSLGDKPSPSLLASGNRLLVFHLNKAIIFDLDEAQDLRVVAAGSLPGTVMKVLGFKDDQIDLLASGQVVRARLPAIPPREVLARVLSARYPPPARAEQIEMARLQTTAGDGTATSLKLKRLLALEANNRCRKQLGAFFAQEPFSEKADEEQRSQLRKEIGQYCSSQLSDAAKIPLAQWRPDAVSLALEEAGVPWPRSASNILHAAEAGDKQALWIIAGWASQGVKDKFDSAMPANEAWGKIIHRAIGRGDINPELRLDDPELLKMIAIAQTDTKKLQEVSVNLRNSDRPWIHDRIGDRMREGDFAIRRGAMFHYALAETLYAAAGLESYAHASAEKRASIARIMAPDEITEAQNLIANWTASTPPPASPKDDPTRLREDLKSLDRLASSLEQEEFRLVLSEISRRIAATSRRLDSALADEGQRKSALLASSYARPLSDKTAQDVLDRWSGEFGRDRSFLVAMLARLLSAVEKENSAGSGLYLTSDLRIHKKVTELIIQNLQSDPVSLAAIADNLSLNRRAFSYATVRGSDREQVIAAASALKSRDKLLTLLLEHNANNENYLAHRGVGRFWMGTSVGYALASSSKVQEAGKTVQEMVGPQSKNIQEALTDLRKARELGDQNFETLRRLADSQHWFFPKSTLVDYDAEAKDAISNYESLTKALSDKRWSTSVTMAGLLSEYAELLRNLSSHASQLDDKLDEGWRLGDESIRTRSAGLIVDSLYYASLADRTVHDASNAAGNSWGKEPGTNRAYAYALSRLANRLMAAKNELRPASDCDRAASHAADPLRRAPPAALKDLADAARYSAAKAACESAYREQDPNASFLLARVLLSSNDEEEKKRAAPLFHEAASQKYAAAFNSIAILLKQPEKKSKYFYNYTQLVVRDHFSATFKYLSAQAPPNEKKRDALRWLAEQAAGAGVVEAHEALADMTSNQEKRKMHLLIAARLSTDATKSQLAARADQIVLSPQSDRDAQKDAGKFVPSPVEAFESSDEEELVTALKAQS